MKRFNLSEWAITHQSLVLFMIVLLGAAGIYAYRNLGRAEDPSFTIKTMVVQVAWPGATATEMQEQVAGIVPEARSTTSWGTPALDLGAGVHAQFAAAGVDDVRAVDTCTREDASWPSYRRDGAGATRFAGVVWSHP